MHRPAGGYFCQKKLATKEPAKPPAAPAAAPTATARPAFSQALSPTALIMTSPSSAARLVRIHVLPRAVSQSVIIFPQRLQGYVVTAARTRPSMAGSPSLCGLAFAQPRNTSRRVARDKSAGAQTNGSTSGDFIAAP